KLSWVSPLRGKYLFTHRNGLKAFSLTREELAQRFRDDTASPVETEPLLDRAFSDVLSRLSTQAGVCRPVRCVSEAWAPTRPVTERCNTRERVDPSRRGRSDI